MKNKYRAKKTTIDGITFASQREGKRYTELKILEKAGKISDLELQVVYQPTHNGVKLFKYLADFVYCQNGQTVIEDVKGFKTPVYRLKKKIVEAFFLIKITET